MLKRLLRDRSAAVLPIFAIALIPMLLALGGVIDFARAYSQRTVVQDAMDAAALASGKQIGKMSDTAVKAEATAFYDSNVGNAPNIKPTITPVISGSTITLTTTLNVPTYFLGLVGLNQFTFNLTSVATSASGTLEVAMVLDNSTSMTLPSTKISTLKTAATDLATTLWALGATSTKADPVKIAVVPFGGAVNVGASSALSDGWIDTQGKGYSSTNPYPTQDSTLLGGSGNASPSTWIPYSVFSTLKDSSNNAISWAGCVEERPAPYDVSDDAPSTATTPTSEEKKTLFEPMVAPDEPDNWNCSTSSCDYLGTTSSNRRYNGTPTGSQTYNNYLPDAGDANTCGTTDAAFTITTGKPARLNKSSHGLSAGDTITIGTTGTLPSPFSSGSTYYVSPAGLATGSFYVTTTTTGTSITSIAAGTLALSSISNAKPAVFTDNSHGLTIGTSLTLATSGTLPSPLSTSTTYYVASTTTNTFTVTTASAATTLSSISRASPGVFTTSSNHGLAVGDAVVLSTSNTLPSPLTVNTVYYVKTVPTTKTFTVTATSGGSVINTTSSGSGTHKFTKLVATTTAGSGSHSYIVAGLSSVFTKASHGLSVGDAIAISSSGTLPTPLSASTIYYVASVPTTSTFTLATGSATGTGVIVTGTYTGTLSFIELLATTSTSQSGTHSYYINASAYTCANGDCSGSVPGRTEKQAFGGQSVTASPVCKYGTSGNKATAANITVANLSGTGKGGPNFMCTTTAITPLTTTEATITSAINAMQANGYTNITSGLMWGWRVLSPGVPFTEGRGDDVTDNKKIIVLMTDGENTYLPYLDKFVDPGTNSYAGKFVKSAYGAWSYIAENHLGTTSTTPADVFVKLNERTAAACTAAKAADITIYTVGFEINDTTSSDPAAAKLLLQNCASDTGKYYDAADEDDLLAAFTAIGNDISQLRLSQ